MQAIWPLFPNPVDNRFHLFEGCNGAREKCIENPAFTDHVVFISTEMTPALKSCLHDPVHVQLDTLLVQAAKKLVCVLAQNLRFQLSYRPELKAGTVRVE